MTPALVMLGNCFIRIGMYTKIARIFMDLQKIINIFGYRSVDIQVDQNEYQTKTDKIQEALATVTVFDFSQSNGMKEELKFSSPISDNSDIKWQSQTCICDLGDLCNFGIVHKSCSLSVLLIMSMTVLILMQ